MVRFGPAGNSDSFYEQGFKSTMEMPVWVNNMGLNAFEYPCTKGVRISEASAKKLGIKAAENNIKLSLHAPYYINFASYDAENIEKTKKHLFDSAIAASNMGADRVVFHPGAVGKGSRAEALENTKKNLYSVIELIKNTAPEVHLCPETAGKKNQLGDLGEILKLCLLDSSIIPTFDFGHLHAYDFGALKAKEDFQRIFERTFEVLGDNRAKDIHIHFSRIEYTEKGGEKKHWTLNDIQYGPEFEPLAACLVEYGVNATIICESRGTMAEDAAKMKNIYDKMVNL